MIDRPGDRQRYDAMFKEVGEVVVLLPGTGIWANG